jgi:hypothetical protein
VGIILSNLVPTWLDFDFNGSSIISQHGVFRTEVRDKNFQVLEFYRVLELYIFISDLANSISSIRCKSVGDVFE